MMTTDPYRLLPSQAMNRRIHHRHSPQSVAVSLASRLIVKNAVRAWAIQPNLHWPLEYVDGFAGLVPRFGSSANIEPVRLADCAAEWVRAPGVSAERAILYLHGGAFLTCGLNTHRSLVTRLSKAADAAVLNVGYRKLPSHQITDAIDDGISGLRWLQDRGFDGDRDRRGRRLGWGISRIHDHTVGHSQSGHETGRSCDRLALHGRRSRAKTEAPQRDAGAPCSRVARCRCSPDTSARRGYWASEGDSAGRVVSPVDADLSSLPPVTIHASSDELLLPDAELMAERLEASGIRCDLHLWDGQIHDFPLAADVLPEGRRAIRYIGDFVQDVTAAPGKLPYPGDREAS